MTRITLDLSQPLPLALFADPIDSAIVLSLFCDARALAEDRQPDPRGWWGDALAGQPFDRWGSRLWLLAQRARTCRPRCVTPSSTPAKRCSGC